MQLPPDPSATRVAILSAAVTLFGQHGYTGTSMRDIANTVGLLPGSLYAHINSKEALLIEIVTEGIRDFLSAVEPHVGSPGPAARRFRSAIKAHVRVVAKNPERSLVVFHQWRFLTGENRNTAVEYRRRYEQAFTDIFQDGARSGQFNPNLNTRVTVLAVLGALNWTPEWYSPRGGATVEELGNLMADTLMVGLLVDHL